MTFCPSGHCLCRTLQEQSTRVWNDLEDADRYQTPRYEETISQDLCLHLNKSHPDTSRTAMLSKAEEGNTGADFLWLIYDETMSDCILLAVQAKRIWREGRHAKYTAFKKAQAKSLIDWSRSANAFPLYLLYNYHAVRPAVYGRWPLFRAIYPDYHWDHPRDLGLLAFRADGLDNIPDGQLAPNNPFNHPQFPMWMPFCLCQQQIGRPIDAFAETLTIDVHGEDEGRAGAPIRQISDVIKNWLSGESTLSSEELRRALDLPLSERDNFNPSFVQALNLGSPRARLR